jgi:predicted porin
MLNKSVISMAIFAAFGKVACAQSSLTLYGTLDVGMQAIRSGAATNGSIYKLIDSAATPSNFGIQGREDLGGGMSVIFDLDAAISPATGAGEKPAVSGTVTSTTAPASLFNHNAWVGLKSDFGTLTLGRNFTATLSALLNDNAILSGPDTGWVTTTTAQGIQNDYWNSNQIKYESPGWSGFSFQAAYVPGGNAGDFRQGTNYGGSVAFHTGDLLLTAGGQYDNDNVDSDKNVNWNFVTASYTTGSFRLTAGYDRVNNAGDVVGWVGSRLWTVGGSYYVTPDFGLAAQYFSVKTMSNGSSSNQIVLNANYQISKRTSVYVLAGHTQNGSNPIMVIDPTPSAAYGNATGIAIGMEHQF